MIDLAGLSTLTDAEWNTLCRAIATEGGRRSTLASVPTQVAEANTAYLAASGRVTGAAWVQPTGAHDAYPLGYRVTYGGKTWESLIGANVWTPGGLSWREVSTGGTAPAWVQPTGSTDAYPLGAKVTHKSKTWTSTVAANEWEPGVYGWVQTCDRACDSRQIAANTDNP